MPKFTKADFQAIDHKVKELKGKITRLPLRASGHPRKLADIPPVVTQETPTVPTSNPLDDVLNGPAAPAAAPTAPVGRTRGRPRKAATAPATPVPAAAQPDPQPALAQAPQPALATPETHAAPVPAAGKTPRREGESFRDWMLRAKAAKAARVAAGTEPAKPTKPTKPAKAPRDPNAPKGEFKGATPKVAVTTKIKVGPNTRPGVIKAIQDCISDVQPITIADAIKLVGSQIETLLPGAKSLSPGGKYNGNPEGYAREYINIWAIDRGFLVPA